MPIERIRFDETEQETTEPALAAPKRQMLGWVEPTTGPYKGQAVAVYKRGTSGVHGHLESGEEVYLFYSELKKPTRRIK